MKEIYPVTIILDRYNGVYSGGKWTAWNMDFDMIPPEVDEGDPECNSFFLKTNIIYGKGNTPEEALQDLTKRLNEANNK